MGVIGPDAFERAVRRLDRSSFVAFVAALYDARGRETTVEGSTIHLADGRTVTCRCSRPWYAWHNTTDGVGHTDAASEERADIIVSARPSERIEDRARTDGARYVGPAELRKCLLYGIDRSDAKRLCRQYLDRPLVTQEDDIDRSRSLVAVAVFLLLVGTIAAAAGPLAVELRGANTAKTGVPTETAVDEAGESNGSTRAAYPPGVTRDGISDLKSLVHAHRALTRNRSYQLLVRGHGGIRAVRPWPPGSYQFAGSPRWLSLRQRITVERSMVFRSRLTGRYLNSSGQPELVVIDDYADGTAIYRRFGGSVSPKYTQIAKQDDHIQYAVNGYLLRYLLTTETRVERLSADRFRIIAAGTPLSVAGPVTNYSAVAIVSRNGFVSRLSVSYERPEPRGETGPAWSGEGRTADGNTTGSFARETVFELQYSDVNRTDVPRPEWYDAARRATGSSTHPAGLWPGYDNDTGRAVNETGTVNAVALAETHHAALRGRSYEWSVRQWRTQRAGVIEGSWLHARQSLVFENTSRYSFSVSGAQIYDKENRARVNIDLYADGSYRYRRIGGPDSGSPPTPIYKRVLLPVQPRDPFADLAERYIRRYLATDEASVTVVDAETHRYRIVATGEPTNLDVGITDYRAVATVTDTGLVRSLRVSYHRQSPVITEQVPITFEYSNVGNATVSQPTWYEEARNATEGS